MDSLTLLLHISLVNRFFKGQLMIKCTIKQFHQPNKIPLLTNIRITKGSLRAQLFEALQLRGGLQNHKHTLAYSNYGYETKQIVMHATTHFAKLLHFLKKPLHFVMTVLFCYKIVAFCLKNVTNFVLGFCHILQ